MFSHEKFLILILNLLLITACGGGDGTTKKSSDVNFTTTSILDSNVNDPVASDGAPEISSNGLELYFHSTRAGGIGRYDIWVSTRSTKFGNWQPAINLSSNINSVSDDRAPTISRDGLTLIFSSDRSGSLGGLDLYMSTRTTLNGAWSSPVNLGAVLNTGFTEAGPEISNDGLSLYYQSDESSGTYGNLDLYVSTRTSLLDSWGTGINLGSVINSPDFDLAPSIASDGLTLYFHSTRTGGPGSHNIWKTTRTSTQNAWNTPEVLPMPVNSTTIELGPSLSDDWKTLYFASDFGGNRNIWKAEP